MGNITRMPKSGPEMLLDLIQERFPGYHPIVAMAEVAHDEEANLALKFQAHKEIAQYVTPKLQSTQFTVRDEDDVLHVVLDGEAEEVLAPPPPLTDEQLEQAEGQTLALEDHSSSGEEEVPMYAEVPAIAVR